MLPASLWWLEESGLAHWDGLDMTALRMDQAYVRVHNEEEEDPLWLYTLSEDCHEVRWWRSCLVLGDQFSLAYPLIVIFTRPMARLVLGQHFVAAKLTRFSETFETRCW